MPFDYFDQLAAFCVVLGLGIALFLGRRRSRFVHVATRGLLGGGVGFMFALLGRELVDAFGRDPVYGIVSSLPQVAYERAVVVIDFSLSFVFTTAVAAGAAIGLICGYAFPVRHATEP